MKIKVLGTAAAEAIPSIWCECETCQKARALGGKDLRRRASYLIDDDTMVDCGPDFHWQIREFGIDERKLKRIIFTHRHSDHLNGVDFEFRLPGFAVVSSQLHILAARQVMARIMAIEGIKGTCFDMTQMNMTPVVLEAGKPCQDGDINIMSAIATHDPGGDPLVLFIERHGAKVFICHDSGLLTDEALEQSAGQQADGVFVDCTCAFRYPDCAQGHLGNNAALKQIENLKANGAIKDNAKIFVTHFSHNGWGLHADLEAFFNPKGIGVAYDGMEVEI
jgi:phosphoribosyl 1,2-cyclic phosphate phosphodiesterase